MIQFTQSSRFIRYKADPIFYPTCDLEQEGKLAICNFRPVVTGQQAAQAGDTEEKIAPRVTRRLRPSQLRPEIEDSNNQTRLYSALCGLGPNKTVTAGKQFSNTENTDFIPVLQRETDWLTKKCGGKPKDQNSSQLLSKNIFTGGMEQFVFLRPR